MELNFSGEVATRLVAMIKKDKKLARSLAGQFLANIDRQVIADYLFSNEVALDLLSERLTAAPERTVRDLTRMTNGPLPRRGRPAGNGRRRRAAKPAGRPRGGKRRRTRLTGDQAEQLRSQVRSFLSKKPWSGRKELRAAVAFPSEGLYNRIMGELKDSGVVAQKGERSKATYALKKRASE